MTFEDVLGNSLAFVPFLTGTHANILTRRRVPDDFDLIRFVCFFSTERKQKCSIFGFSVNKDFG